jgi:DNA modification methylase
VLADLAADTVQTVVTSPPYWSLRDYGIPGQIGLEESVDAYIGHLARVFAQVRRVLRDDGTLWLNIGDSYTSGGRTWRATDRKNGSAPWMSGHRRPTA